MSTKYFKASEGVTWRREPLQIQNPRRVFAPRRTWWKARRYSSSPQIFGFSNPDRGGSLNARWKPEKRKTFNDHKASMATWKERGIVPDSEDEFGSDSDDDVLLPPPVPVPRTVLQEKSSSNSLPPDANSPVPAETSDIWDLPFSSQKENQPPQSQLARPKTPTEPYFQLVSSPLSEPPSDLGIDADESQSPKRRAPIQPRNYARVFSPDPLAFSPANVTDIRPPSSKPTRQPPENETPNESNNSHGVVDDEVDGVENNDENGESSAQAEDISDLNQMEEPLSVSNTETGIDYPTEDLESGELHIGRRTFRPRKPIQKHPYALENALYSKIFKSHGLKPVRLQTQESSQQRKGTEDDSQEKDFEEDTQETTNESLETSDESQERPAIEEANLLDDLGSSSPITPTTSLPRHQGGPSSQPSADGTENTSVDGDADLDEFPPLEELVNALPQHSSSTRSKKRKSLSYSSISAKRSRLSARNERPGNERDDIYALTPSRPYSIEQRRSQTTLIPKLKIPDDFSLSPPSPKHNQRPQDTRPSPPPTEPLRLETPRNRPIDLTAETDDESADESSDSSASGSESEVIREVGKRLRGVLPPSYLRLDETKEAKHQRSNQPNRPAITSPGKLPRRGVAQRRTPGPETPITPRPIFDVFDDDDEDNAVPLGAEESPIPMVQTTLVLEPDEGETDDNDLSAMEDNQIDVMLPVRKRSSAVLSKAYGTKPAKRPKLNTSQTSQSRITSHFGGSDMKGPSKANPLKLKPQRRTRRGMPTSRRRPPQNRNTGPVPKLGILDVIEPDAPRFLKIAARTARRSDNLGRSSPTRKVLQMATRWDHLDVNSVMQKWRGGHLKPRPLTKNHPQPRPKPNPQLNISHHVRPRPMFRNKKLITQLDTDGNFTYTQSTINPTSTAHNAPRPEGQTTSGAYLSSRPLYRPAQLETTVEQNKYTFHAKKKALDDLWRRTRGNSPSVGPFSITGSILQDDVGRVLSTGPAETTDAPGSVRSITPTSSTSRAGNRSKFRKRFIPKEIDTTAPQFSYANEPSPQPLLELSSNPIDGLGNSDKLNGLGPFGTQYTHHFEIFPLDSDVFFHETTLIGQGRIDKATDGYDQERLEQNRGRTTFELDGKTLRWGSWNEQVSSEVGILMDWMADHFHTPSQEFDLSRNATALQAADFMLNYIQDSMSLPDPAAEQSFAYRILELLKGFQERIETDRPYSKPQCRTVVLDVLSRMLTLAFTCTHICRKSPSLIDTRIPMEDLLVRISKTTAGALLDQGIDAVLKFLEDSRQQSSRQRGVRRRDVIIQSWVVLMRTLEVARIPRSGFWDVLYSVMITNDINTETDCGKLEALWKTMFSLLPLREFDSHGAIVVGIRRKVSMDGWALPQRLIKRVLDLYKQNRRQAASFNDYCRALISRCHYLAQEWGWSRCGGIVGSIFDFFGSQDLSHLRNEEAFKSPRFLDELAGNPSLAIEREDRCFHIFLKFVVVVIKRLRDRGATNEIRNLIARLMPNHSRVYLKDQPLHSHDLASLRNHHDLLCTLFWAAPPQLRPGAHILETLIKPGDSHKDACLVNLKAWNQLARYIVATEEDAEVFKVFRRWQFGMFQQLLDQFKMAESDAQEQYLALSKDDSQAITQARIELVVSMNRAVAKEIIHACLKASLDTMSYARSLKAAAFALNSLQLEEIFNHFSLMPVTLDWAILRRALETVSSYLTKVDALCNMSDCSAGVPAGFSQAMTALHRELSPSFFSMARCVLGSHEIQPKSTVAKVDKDVCIELAVVLSAKLLSGFARVGLVAISQAFGRGKCSLFQVDAHRLSLSHRRYLPLFVAILLKQGPSDATGLGSSLLNLWLLAIVKPRRFLAYENQLAEELKRRHEPFVPEAVVGLSIDPDYGSNHELFACKLPASPCHTIRA